MATLDPVYCGSKYSAHSGKTTYYAEQDASDTCERCDAPIIAVTTYGCSAYIVSGDGDANIQRNDLASPVDPLRELANYIGARMPFTVTRVATPNRSNHGVTLVGAYTGGAEITIRVDVVKQVTWCALFAPTDSETEVAS